MEKAGYRTQIKRKASDGFVAHTFLRKGIDMDQSERCLYQEKIEQIRTLYLQSAFWHGTGRFRYRRGRQVK